MSMTFATNIVPDTSLSRYVGTSSKRFKINGYEIEILEISVTATSSTSTSVSDSSITAQHIVLNDAQIAASNISWITVGGSITLSCPDGIPEMTLYLGIKK